MKYEKVWRDDRYRNYSPGEGLVQSAFTSLNMNEGDTLIDYGCGTGRALRHFRDWGLRVRGIDIADNCLEVDVPFTQACLWDMPPVDSKWAFCTDVMEHIPEERVDDVLREITVRTDEAAFFQIGLTRDAAGPLLIGEPLHLTVHNMDWWYERLSEHWETVGIEKRGTSCVAVCHGPR